MNVEVKKPTAGGSESPVTKNVSADAYAKARAEKAKQAPPATPDPGKAPEEKKPTGDAKESAAPEKAEAPKDTVPSKEVDLDTLSDEEITELAQKGKSGLLKRIAELTAKRKLAEEQLAAERQARLAEKQALADPLASDKPKVNPYSNLTTVEQLKAKAAEVEDVISWAEEVLDKADGLPSDEIIERVNGQEVTKAKVKQILKDAQRARKEHLPAQLRELNEAGKRQVLKSQMSEAARKEIPWLDGAENAEAKQQFESIRSGEIFQKAAKAVPELEPYLDYFIGHAVNSIYSRKAIPLETTPTKPAQITPPSTPAASAAKTEKPEARNSAIRDLEERVKKTGSPKDFAAFRAAQFSRKPI
jgi:hypothetical protein